MGVCYKKVQGYFQPMQRKEEIGVWGAMEQKTV